MRTFIAIELPETSQRLVAASQQRLANHLQALPVPAPFSWTRPEQTHLTLRFLGEADERQLAAVSTTLAQHAGMSQPFTLLLQGPGGFPNWRAPRVIWLGLQGDLAGLHRLQTPIEALARQAGFPAENRPFSPHLTIARARRNADPAQLRRAGELLRTLAETWAGPITPGGEEQFLVEELVLMRSELLPGGARYTVLGRFELKGDMSPAT